MEDEDREYWSQLFEAYKESAAQYDKQVLYIAAGSLGITMTFITDIVQINLAICKPILTVAWSILALVIMMSLLSHYLSMKAMNFKMENLMKSYDKKSRGLNRIVEKLNLAMLIGLPLGIILIIVFISINI